MDLAPAPTHPGGRRLAPVPYRPPVARSAVRIQRNSGRAERRRCVDGQDVVVERDRDAGERPGELARVGEGSIELLGARSAFVARTAFSDGPARSYASIRGRYPRASSAAVISRLRIARCMPSIVASCSSKPDMVPPLVAGRQVRDLKPQWRGATRASRRSVPLPPRETAEGDEPDQHDDQPDPKAPENDQDDSDDDDDAAKGYPCDSTTIIRSSHAFLLRVSFARPACFYPPATSSTPDATGKGRGARSRAAAIKRYLVDHRRPARVSPQLQGPPSDPGRPRTESRAGL
jgi:hypothetical protein